VAHNEMEFEVNKRI